MESEKIKIKKTGKIEKILENQPWGFNSQIKGILGKKREWECERENIKEIIQENFTEPEFPD